MANVKEDALIERNLKEWDEFYSGTLGISGRAEEFIAKRGVKESLSEYPEKIKGFKLRLLQLESFLETY